MVPLLASQGISILWPVVMEIETVLIVTEIMVLAAAAAVVVVVIVRVSQCKRAP